MVFGVVDFVVMVGVLFFVKEWLIRLFEILFMVVVSSVVRIIVLFWKFLWFDWDEGCGELVFLLLRFGLIVVGCLDDFYGCCWVVGEFFELDWVLLLCD